MWYASLKGLNGDKADMSKRGHLFSFLICLIMNSSLNLFVIANVSSVSRGLTLVAIFFRATVPSNGSNVGCPQIRYNP